MSRTNTAIHNAKPGSKPVKLFDKRGLYLEVSPNGGKWWRLKYRYGGKKSVYHSASSQMFLSRMRAIVATMHEG